MIDYASYFLHCFFIWALVWNQTPHWFCKVWKKRGTLESGAVIVLGILCFCVILKCHTMMRYWLKY